MIRHAHEKDVPVLVDIGLQAWEKAVSGVADAGAMRRVAELSFLSFLRSNWFLVSIIENGGAVAGWAAREDRDGTISDLWIEPALQRSGLGSSLLADLEQRIRLMALRLLRSRHMHRMLRPSISFASMAMRSVRCRRLMHRSSTGISNRLV